MSEKNDIKEMQKIAKTLIAEGIIKKDGCISQKRDHSMLITAQNADLSNLQETDIAEIDLETGSKLTETNPANEFKIHQTIYNNREDLTALIHSTQQSVLTSSKAGKTVKPTLDDMAQIAGVTVKIADVSDALSKQEAKKLVKKIKGRHALFLKDRGIICGSTSLHDAHAVCMVMDKACKSFIEAEIIGGGVYINRIESALMRFIYLKKYSKQAVKNK